MRHVVCYVPLMIQRKHKMGTIAYRIQAANREQYIRTNSIT